MTIEVSKRLKTIALFVHPYKHIVDVGTDHCFVPLFLVLNQKIEAAIATDVNEGPLNEAKRNVEDYHLEDKIKTRIGNGLEPLNEEDKCDCIIIAGMGGKLITHILNSKPSVLRNNKRLILQPNVSEAIVRLWLVENHYEIVQEKIIEEDRVKYEIIVADKCRNKVDLSPADKMFGPILRQDKSALFQKKWQDILQYKENIVKQIPDNHPNKAVFIKEIKLIKNMLEGIE